MRGGRGGFGGYGGPPGGMGARGRPRPNREDRDRPERFYGGPMIDELDRPSGFPPPSFYPPSGFEANESPAAYRSFMGGPPPGNAGLDSYMGFPGG